MLQPWEVRAGKMVNFRATKEEIDDMERIRKELSETRDKMLYKSYHWRPTQSCVIRWAIAALKRELASAKAAAEPAPIAKSKTPARSSPRAKGKKVGK